MSKTSWTDLIEEMVEYLNNYVRPHELYSISIFEDNHKAKVDEESVDSDQEEDSSDTEKE
jgi:hypothetical protein